MTLGPNPVPSPKLRYRPPIGIPNSRQPSTGSAFLSVLLHALLIFLLVGPIFLPDVFAPEREGAGGRSARGGGGGGNRGGATAEKLNYIQVPTPPPPPPAVQKTAIPQLVPPPVVKPPEPQPEQPKAEAVPSQATVVNAAGTGGTGNDGAKGTGPGSGGGVGSGEGTGRGSGNGPGTGGGTGRIYPPYVTNLALLPMPVPSKVRPYTLVAVFEVDEQGHAKLLHFNESKDASYNKKIRAMLAEIRFRPATKPDGTPVRDTTSIVAEARL